MIKVLFASISLFCVTCAQAKDRFTWITVENSELEVKAKGFLDSGVTGAEWAKFLTSKGDPFGRENHFFQMEIRDKRTGSNITVPMVPAAKLTISPKSLYIAVLSTNFPSDGVVVVSRRGKVVFSEFSVCFSDATCPVVSDYLSTWFYDTEVAVTFSSSQDGDDCALTIQASASDPNSPKIRLDVCQGQKRLIDNAH